MNGANPAVTRRVCHFGDPAAPKAASPRMTGIRSNRRLAGQNNHFFVLPGTVHRPTGFEFPKERRGRLHMELKMELRGKRVDLDEPATFYENRFTHGVFFGHLSQALRHAVCAPLTKQHPAASIVTQSGAQFGWEEINVLHDHLKRAH
ncbi:hypothetical protein PV773_08290 [Mesorhizobium sp. CC13]|uniref:hypothetical protein n=1 Tax=Mesorhizobium sp. CC13 TaxID=3029194 RepID=UPI0032674C3E